MTAYFNEEAVKVFRINASAAMNGVSARSMRWVVLLSNGRLAKGGPQKIRPAARGVLAGHSLAFGQDGFHAEGGQHSFEAKHFDTMIRQRDRGTFPQIRPEVIRALGLGFLAYSGVGDFSKLQLCWRCLLAIPGMLLFEEFLGKKTAMRGMELHSTEHYTLIWRAELLSMERKILTWAPRDPYWQLVHIYDISSFLLCPVRPIAPGALHVMEGLEGRYELAFGFDQTTKTMLIANANNAFVGLNVDVLENCIKM